MAPRPENVEPHKVNFYIVFFYKKNIFLKRIFFTKIKPDRSTVQMTLDLFLPTSGDGPFYGAMVERRDGPSWLRDDDDDDIVNFKCRNTP